MLIESTRLLFLLSLALALTLAIASQTFADTPAPGNSPASKPSAQPATKPSATTKPAATKPAAPVVKHAVSPIKGPAPDPAWPSDKPVLVSDRGSERATTGPGNNIVTRDGRTHLAWQEVDATGYYDVVRTLDRATGKWSPIFRVGPAKDNHARPALAIDSQGFLHLVIGGHVTMMTYYKSKLPNDASAWERPVAVGVGTYPMLICGADDTLVLAARHDSEPRGLNLFVKKAGGNWHVRENVFQRRADHPGYSGFNAALAWGPDGKRLHLAIDSYESGREVATRGVYQAVAYMCTDDLGVTWQKADGSAIPAKATTEKLDMIAQVDVGMKPVSPPIALRNGGLVVDAKGKPYVYFIEITEKKPKARLVTPGEDGKWRDLPLDEAFRKAWPDAKPSGARGSLSMTADGAMHVLFMIEPAGARDDRPNPEDEKFDGNYGVGLLSTSDGGQTFTPRNLLPFNPEASTSLSNIERQTGHNDLKDRLPSALWMDGLQRYPKPDEYINTRVYWTQPR
ncbi:MAG: BNR-4 repeat-containing protein [Planctomycetota bacterium]|nr:BNR-4 repeat-containing protein [Planctomycetota bacterium]